MRPASAACARVAGNSTAFRRTCLWKSHGQDQVHADATRGATRYQPTALIGDQREPGCSPSEESRFGCVALFEAGASMRADTND